MPRGGIRPNPTCGHPNRPHAGRGRCKTCLATLRRREKGVPIKQKLQATCHPDRPNYGHGKCQTCYKLANKEKFSQIARNRELGKKFGISQKEYDRVFNQQKGLCAICSRPERRSVKGKLYPLVVDHDHISTEIRGLICHTCNVALGLLRESPTLLRKAADYIERHLSEGDRDYGL